MSGRQHSPIHQLQLAYWQHLDLDGIKELGSYVYQLGEWDHSHIFRFIL
jgi:hypothetical protein